MGGREATAKRLDTFFGKLNAGPNEPYMWAGNEVDFGVPWVYNDLGLALGDAGEGPVDRDRPLQPDPGR
ncbi:glycoside hydrolase domain-containing protein [Streptomyces kaempferi]